MKEMIYFVYNYIQQKEKIDKDCEPGSSSPEHSRAGTSTGSGDSLVSSPASLASVLSPGARSSVSDSSLASPYGLLQMVNTSAKITRHHTDQEMNGRYRLTLAVIFRLQGQSGPGPQLRRQPRHRGYTMTPR